MLKVLLLVVPCVGGGVVDIVQGQVVVDADVIKQELAGAAVPEGSLNRVLVVINEFQVARGKVLGQVDLGGLECQNRRRGGRLTMTAGLSHPQIGGITARRALCKKWKESNRNNEKLAMAGIPDSGKLNKSCGSSSRIKAWTILYCLPINDSSRMKNSTRWENKCPYAVSIKLASPPRYRMRMGVSFAIKGIGFEYY